MLNSKGRPSLSMVVISLVLVTAILAQFANGTGIQQLQSGGAPLPFEPFLNFIGGTTCVNNAGSTRIDCTTTTTATAVPFAIKIF